MTEFLVSSEFHNSVNKHGWPYFYILNALIGLSSLLPTEDFTYLHLPLFPNAILDSVSTNCADSTTMIAVSRKLKENGSGISSNKKDGTGHVSLDDYQPVDPTPSSKTSLKPGPIEHGSPLNPFIPKPSPPPHPPPGGF